LNIIIHSKKIPGDGFSSLMDDSIVEKSADFYNKSNNAGTSIIFDSAENTKQFFDR
jgi:hypothetical protein